AQRDLGAIANFQVEESAPSEPEAGGPTECDERPSLFLGGGKAERAGALHFEAQVRGGRSPLCREAAGGFHSAENAADLVERGVGDGSHCFAFRQSRSGS